MPRSVHRRAALVAGLIAALLALLTVAAVPASALTPSAAAPTKVVNGVEMDAAKFEHRILELLNADRARKGMDQLKRVKELDTVARNWSRHMADKSRMYHNPQYSSQIPSGWRMAGENVAYGYPTPEAMYEGWYNSPGHYRNMFNRDFTHIGIGIAHSDKGWYVAPYGTQNFATYPKSKKLTTTPQYNAPAQPPAPKPIPADDGSSTRNIDDGGIGGTGRSYYLNNRFGGDADVVFQYGNAAGRVYVGDWDGDGRDSLAYRIGNTFYIRNANSSGRPHTVIHYGRPGDRVYVGDWNGDGKDTFAVRRGKVYHFKNSLTGGDADSVIAYGRAGDNVLVGDWNGDGRDTLAVRRDRTYHFKNSISGGNADRVVVYGRAGDDVYVGDWNGDKRDTLAVRRGKSYFLKNSISGGNADQVVVYGREADTTLIGDWNGNGRDTIGIRR